MSLRILHVTPYSDAAWAYGGIPRVVGTLARALVQRGHHVTVCATDVRDECSRLPAPDGRHRAGPWRPIDRPDGVVVRIFPNVCNRAAYQFQAFLPVGLRQYLRRHAGTFDVAHLHAYRNVPGLLATHYLRRTGVPFVLAPNGTAPVIERRQLAKRVFDVLFGRSCLSSAARVIAVSEAERRQLLEMGVPASVIRTVPNPVDLEEFTPPVEKGNFRLRHGLTDTPIVLFLGQLTPRKQVDTLVKAFAQTKEPARLVVAGNDRGAGDQARALVRGLGLDARTVFTGLLSGRQRLEALADADVVVYASEYEVFGLVSLEALLTGTPVIVAGDSGCGELIRSVGGGLIVPVGRPDCLAAAIDRILSRPSEWRSAAAGASIRVRSGYGEEVVCKRLEEVYAEVTSRVPVLLPA
jgi:glycosyltransferase involved in cell wall biosynthesis